MRLLLLTLSATLAIQSTFAQTTWGGLTFGMTELQAKKALAGRALRTSDADRQPQDKTSYSPFYVEITLLGSKGEANIVFTRATKRLCQVYTVFKRPFDINRFERELRAKYGEPASMEEGGQMLTMVWKANNQRISAIFTPLFIVINYRPFESDL